MMNGILLIIVTSLAVLGAYYICGLLTDALCRPKEGDVLVLLQGADGEALTNLLHGVNSCLPDAEVLMITQSEECPLPCIPPDNVHWLPRGQVPATVEAFLQKETQKKGK